MNKTYYGKIKILVVLTGVLCALSGCATLREKIYSDADKTALGFFNDLQRSDRQAAYDLFGKGLSQTVSYEQFDQLIGTFQKQWGRIESYNTALMPFHKREGEDNFIPLNTPEDKIKRYIFDVKLENAEVNCDLTLVPDGDEYKIVWFSFWGSNIYMTPEIDKKIEGLFSKPAGTEQ